jgi:hypothetical protein
MVGASWATMHPEEASPMAQTIRVLGIGIAKLVCHVVGLDDTGHVVLRKRLARREWRPFMATLPPLRLGMEACGSAHYWARCFCEHGHDVRLIALHFVKAYLKSPKHEARDAETICKAVTRRPCALSPSNNWRRPPSSASRAGTADQGPPVLRPASDDLGCRADRRRAHPHAGRGVAGAPWHALPG